MTDDDATVIRLSDVRSIPDMQVEPDPRGTAPTSPGQEEQPNPITVETWRQFADLSLEDVPCLVADLWPEAAFGFIASPPKKGKTWVGLALALSVATGSTFLNRFDVVEPRPVLYVALEGHRSAITHRTSALARGIGVNPAEEIPNLHFAYKPRGINIADPEWAQHLRRSAEKIQASLIIVDVLRAAARMKENDSSEFSALRANLEPLTVQGVSIALLHHFTKLSETSKERTPGERMSGSGAMYGALDVAIYITGSDDGARKLRLEFEARDISSPDMLGVRLEGNGSGPNGGFTARDRAWWESTLPPDEDELSVTADHIKEWLVENGPATRGQIATVFEISEKTVARREIRLLQMGVRATRRHGKPTLLSVTADNPQVEVDPGHDPGQDSLDTCPTQSVSNPNPSIHAKTAWTRDSLDTTPVSTPENAVFAGKTQPGQPGHPTGGVPPVRGTTPEVNNTDENDNDGIPY